MQNVRIVTVLPAPTPLTDYEPFIRKSGGSHPFTYGLQTLHRPSVRQLETLKQHIQASHRLHHSAGFILTDFSPAAVILSLSQSCLTDADRPLALPTFIKFCCTLQVPLFLISNGEQPFFCELNHENSLRHLLLNRQAFDTSYEEWAHKIPQAESRWLFMQDICTRYDLSPGKVIVVSNQAADFSFFARFAGGINFAGPYSPLTTAVHGYSTQSDCIFLSLLLFGRDVAHVRGLAMG